MKYNPLTQTLFTDAGEYIKQLHCPLSKQWHELDSTNSLKGKMCRECDRHVYDTAHLSDEELHQIVVNDPHTCLKIDLNQPNLTITYNNER